jgi:hypothetical protein
VCHKRSFMPTRFEALNFTKSFRFLTKPRTTPFWHTSSAMIAAPSQPTKAFREQRNKDRLRSAMRRAYYILASLGYFSG